MNGSTTEPATFEVSRAGGRTVVRVRGRLDVESTPGLWEEARRAFAEGEVPAEIDASRVVSCDTAGAAWLSWLGAPVTGANSQVATLLRLVGPRREPPPVEPAGPHLGPERWVEHVGHAAADALHGARDVFTYVGTLASGVALSIRHPGRVRWNDLLLYMGRTGNEALPIVALISFLVGIILAFQGVVLLGQYGTGMAETYVAKAVGKTLLMEFGALMTAIIMAGRSGSAFAAEIGTMKVNEEVDALRTMGLDATRFLVVPKFLALAMTMPLLVTFANFCGVYGGMLTVWLLLNKPMAVYLRETVDYVTLWETAQGYIKGEAYAFVIAGVGCQRGLRTGTGAQGVGLSATSAVVTSVFLIIVADAVLTVVFHYV